MVKVSALKEIDALGAKSSRSLFANGLERPLVLCLSFESTIARLEMRACDVGCSQLVEASVDLSTGGKRVPELDLRADSGIETVVTGNND